MCQTPPTSHTIHSSLVSSVPTPTPQGVYHLTSFHPHHLWVKKDPTLREEGVHCNARCELQDKRSQASQGGR